MTNYNVESVLNALDHITGGRVIRGVQDAFSGNNPFVVAKTSHLPGKAIVETPGLVCGKLDKPVKKIAVSMTLSEVDIELAGAIGVDVVIAHHPIADAANSGGVPLKGYIELYNVAVMELHEAFHGLHPGISYIHGHRVHRADIAYGGIPGNIMFMGTVLPEVQTLGDMLARLNDFMGIDAEKQVLAEERRIRGSEEIYETSVSVQGKIFVGEPSDPVKEILHIFPHTGFTPAHMEQALRENPAIDTVLATISRVLPDSALVEKARELGLKFIVGNSHALEIYENGLPLAKALQALLPGVDVVLFRERVTATPVNQFGTAVVQEYGDMIAQNFLINKKGGK